MDNNEIPDAIWEHKNNILRYMERLTSNNWHIDYKYLWRDFAEVAQSEGKKIEELIRRYEQPKEQ